MIQYPHEGESLELSSKNTAGRAFKGKKETAKKHLIQ